MPISKDSNQVINDKSKLEKRIKWLRLTFYINIFLVVFYLGLIIFKSTDNSHKLMYWVQCVLWTSISIVYWFEFKKAKVKIQENKE